MTQEANQYWKDRKIKGFIVNLYTGKDYKTGKRDKLHVRARTEQKAVISAKNNSFLKGKVYLSSIRLMEQSDCCNLAEGMEELRINSKFSQGRTIDNLLFKIQRKIDNLKNESERLTELGCVFGHIHYKSDRPNVMYMNIPDPATGERKYLHIGVKPEKQEKAFADLKRFEEREVIEREIKRLKNFMQEKKGELINVINQLNHV